MDGHLRSTYINFSHSTQCNQNEAARKNSLAPILYNYQHQLLLLDTGNMTKTMIYCAKMLRV